MSDPVPSKRVADVATILTHDAAADPTNCLARAVRAGRDGVDDIVFLGSRSDRSGHVVLLDRRTSEVREPDAVGDGGSVPIEDYVRGEGYEILGRVPAAVVRSVVGLPVRLRPAALRDLGGVLPTIAHLAFGAPVRAVQRDDADVKDVKKAEGAGLFNLQRETAMIANGAPGIDNNPHSPTGETPPNHPAQVTFAPGFDQTPSNVPLPVPDSTDKDVHAWLNSLGGSVSDADKAALGQIGDDAHLVMNWLYTNGNKDPDGPGAPDNVSQAWGRLIGDGNISPAIVNAKGHADAGDMASFVKDLDSAARSAQASFAKFEKDDKSSDPVAKEMAVNASILQANEPLLDGAAPNAALDHLFNAADLQAIATGQGPQALKNAADFWSQPGMFSQLDTGGQDFATSKTDGLANNDNLGDWISKQATTLTGPALGSMLSVAAERNMVAGIDTSGVKADFFDHLADNHDGGQKTAVLQQLTDLQAKVAAGADASDWNGPKLGVDGINPDPKQVESDIAGKIAQLTADPDVQQFRSDNYAKSLQAIAGSDPSFHGALQTYYNGDVQGGKALTDALDAKDGDGQKVSAEDGLGAFVQTATTLSLAIGSDGQAVPPVDIQAAAVASGQQGALQQAYTDDILSGKELGDAIDNGTDVGTAVQQFETDAANFGATLPTQFVSDNAQKLQQTFSDTLSDAMERNATPTDVRTAFDGADGTFDAPKVTDAVNQAIAADPSFATDSNGEKVKPDQIVAAVNAVVTDVRNGVKLQDALAKLSKASADQFNDIFNHYGVRDFFDPQRGAPTGAAFEAYKTGVMHAVGAVLNTGIMAAKTAEGAGTGSPTVTASALGSGFQAIGGLLEAGSKYAASAKVGPFTANELTGIESAGKAMGGAGGIVGGAVGIFSGVQALKDGDKAGAGVGIGTGITGAWSGISSLVEGGVGVADATLGSIGADTAALAATSATLGIVGGVATILGVTGLGIYGLVEGAKRVDAFTGEVEPQLQQYGITGGGGVSNNAPTDPLPPVEP